MKIKIIGCSNTWTPRLTSCYLINDNILLDCGCDAYKGYLQTGKHLKDIKLFLFTHMHADHIYGINAFMTYLYRHLNEYTDKPIVVGPKGIKEKCHDIFATSNLFEVDFSALIDFVEIEDGMKFKFDGIEIQGYEFDHGDVVDFGYTLTKDGKTFAYSGDTTLVDSLYPFIEKSDVCILNVSRMITTDKHLGLDAFKTILDRYPDKTLLAAHCDDDVYNQPLIIPHRAEEGMEIEL